MMNSGTRQKYIVCYAHIHFKRGICRACNMCNKFPPSSSCIEPENHSCSNKRGRYSRTESTTNLLTPNISTLSSSSSCNRMSSSTGAGGCDNYEDEMGNMYGSCITPENLFVQSKRSKLGKLFEIINLPTENINKLSTEGMKSIRGNGRELR